MSRVLRARRCSHSANTPPLAGRVETVRLPFDRGVVLLAGVMFIFCSLVSGQEVKPQTIDDDSFTIMVEPSRRKAMVAEAFDVRVIVDVPEGSTVIAPPFGERLGPFAIIETIDWVDLPLESQGHERRRWITQVRLESYQSGFLQIPSIEVSCRLNGNTRILTSAPIHIEITSVLDEKEQPTEIRGLKDVVDVELPEPRHFGVEIIAGSVGLAIAIGLGLFIWVKRRPMSPEKWAETQLSRLALQGSELQGSEASQTSHYGQLSQILREYIEASTGIAATRQTSEELLAELATRDQFGSQVREQLEQFLRDADRTRYVGVTGDESTSGAIARVRSLINELGKEKSNREVV